MSLLVKICGLSTTEAPSMPRSTRAPTWSASCSFRPSPRHVVIRHGADARQRVRARAAKVALTVDADDAMLDAIVEALQPDLLQLHGKEPPARVAALASGSVCR